MKRSSWAWALAIAGCLFIGDAGAQGLRQPFSVQPAGFDYYRYWQDESASPSDQAVDEVPEVPEAPAETTDEAPAEAPAQAPAEDSGTDEAAPATEVEPTPAAGNGTGCCDPCCDTIGCDSCCGAPRGGHKGCCLGLLGDCCLGDPCTLSSYLFCEGSPWSVGGWTQVGYHNKPDETFNVYPGDVNLHQQWFFVEKATDTEDGGFDWGFRADLVYGVDAFYTQAFGNTVDEFGNPRGWDTGWNHGIYGWALPQLYGTVAIGDLSVQLGHFYTIHGYEVVQAPGNFFYSHAFTFFYNEPFTHTGALASYSVNDKVEIHGGWTAGWDTGFDQFEDGSIFLGGISASLTDDASVAYRVAAGDTGFRGRDSYMHSIIVDLNLTEKMNYVFQHDLLDIQEFDEDTYSINQYLFYTINDCLKLGGRIEWWKADPLIAGLGNVSVYEATGGINIFPHANFRVRPEIRHQWAPAANYDETIFGIDAIATF